MRTTLILISLILPVIVKAQEEQLLQKKCSGGDLVSCENLTAYYVKKSQWDNAITLGDALCKKELMKGCTFAGEVVSQSWT